MAKWGEGDPRWIVEERADGTNVNNWHWTEKNATGWSKEKLESLLKGLKIETNEASCEITEVSKCDGEASASNRKAKLIFFYEWDLKMDWSGKLCDSKTTYKGSVVVPNLSDENKPEDLDIQVSAKSEKDEAYKVKEVMRKHGSHVIREQLAKYITDLKAEFSQGMILPTNIPRNSSGSCLNSNIKELSIGSNSGSPSGSRGGSPSLGVKIHTQKIKDQTEFKCRGSELYRALTDQDMVKAFTRGGCQEFEAEKGGRFSLFDGNVTGEFVDLVRDEKIVMRWRFRTWPAEHYSTVTLTIKQKEDCTMLVLAQTGVPDNEIEQTKQGWRNYYFEPIKQTFGFGARLL